MSQRHNQNKNTHKDVHNISKHFSFLGGQKLMKQNSIKHKNKIQPGPACQELPPYPQPPPDSRTIQHLASTEHPESIFSIKSVQKL